LITKSLKTAADKQLLAVLKIFSRILDDWEDVTVGFSDNTSEAVTDGRANAVGWDRICAGSGNNVISLGTLAHELVHIWQQGTSLWSYLAWLISIGFTETIPNWINERLGLPGTSYRFLPGDLGRPFADLTYEQQAEILRYYVEGEVMGRNPIYVHDIGWVRTDNSDPRWGRIKALAEELMNSPPQ
jgi:hypothetical protein